MSSSVREVGEGGGEVKTVATRNEALVENRKKRNAKVSTYTYRKKIPPTPTDKRKREKLRSGTIESKERRREGR